MKPQVFIWEKDKLILTFIDQKGTVSGDLMKSIKFRSPKTIERMKEFVAAIAPKIGDLFLLDQYVFIVAKKHYRNKIKQKDMENLISNLSYKNLKTSNEDYPEFKDLFEKNNIEVYESSQWKYGWDSDKKWQFWLINIPKLQFF